MNKKKKTTSILLVSLVVIMMISGCKSQTPVEPTLDANAIFTQAAETVAAQLTKTALSMPTATNTPTVAPTNTQALPTATSTMVATSLTPQTSVTTTLAPNPNKMEFIGDVTIPDGQIIPPGAKFIKTWKVKNVGATTWTSTFKIRLWAGQQFGAKSSILLGKEVKPNEEAEISIEFTAPLNNGEYYSMWILSDQDEANFGVPFYVKFNVGVTSSSTPTQQAATATTVAPTETSTVEASATP